MTHDDMTRREHVRDGLTRLGIRQKDIAAAVGVTQSLVSRVLRGEKSSCRVLRAVEAALAREEAR